ncbi:MAG: DUF2828 domain-containing protein, partial [Phototrophicales bacterium]
MLNPELLKEDMNESHTLNGGLTNASSLNDAYDLFVLSGSGKQSPQTLINLMHKIDDADLAPLVAYARDIKHGQGQRYNFRVMLQYLGNERPELAKKFFNAIPEIGRWDDMYSFVGTKVEDDMFAFMREQFARDYEAMQNGEPVSLLAKWLKSVNASSKKTRELGKKTARAFKMNDREYRKRLSKLRRHIGIVEQKMCEKNYAEINYEHVPSRAMMLYRRAFIRNDGDRFSDYVASVASGEKKVNASVLYPHDVVKHTLTLKNTDVSETLLDEMWKTLPAYPITEENTLVVVDVSGSMFWSGSHVMPIHASV